MAREKHRFSALDGMRGICAVVVLIFHTFCYSPSNPLPYGYLSVDVFFVLSGFVIAFAFQDRLAAGLGLLGFLKARIRRLGPVLLFGSLFGATVFVTAGFASRELVAVARAAVQNLLLIPSFGVGDALAFPLNAPTWSLFAEFWVNVGFALIATQLTFRVLVAIIVTAWTMVIAFTLSHGTMNFGGTSQYVLVAVLRAVPAFACGVLIFKLWRHGALARIPIVSPIAIFAAWVVLSALPMASVGGLYDLVLVILVVPALIALLVRSEFAVPAWALWLGRISYPLYATHFVLVYAADRFTDWHPNIITEVAVPVISLALADAVARWYEPVVMRALSAPDFAFVMPSSRRIPEKVAERVPSP